MSDAPPPQDPGMQQPPPSGFGQQPAGGYAAPQPQWQGPPLAEWPKRALAFGIDAVFPGLAVGIVATILGAVSGALGLLVQTLGGLAAFAWALYNAYQAGLTGQSFGMKYVGIRLIDERTGQSVGGGLGIGRYFIHIIDSIACLIGWLFPLWDPKKQTFTDKILNHVVIDTGTPAR